MVPGGGIEPSGFAERGYAGTSLHLERCLDTVDLNLNGARGRDRTTDTAIFSRMLYQLSYPGRHSDAHSSGRSGGWSEAL